MLKQDELVEKAKAIFGRSHGKAKLPSKIFAIAVESNAMLMVMYSGELSEEELGYWAGRLTKFDDQLAAERL